MTSNPFKLDIIDNEFSQLLEDFTSVALDNTTLYNAATTAAQQLQHSTPFDMSPLLTSTQKESGNTRDYINDIVSSSAYPPPAQDPQRVLRQMMSLCKHIYSRGLIEGSGSDVTIRAFDKDYHLHRIILYQNTYFSVLLEGPWKENGAKAIELRFDDKNISREAFEIALGRLYGRLDEIILPSQVLSLLATASFLDLQDLCEMCVDVILRDIKDDTVVNYLTFATTHFYGSHSEKITEACFTYLCREGYDNLTLKSAFLSLPAEWLKRVVESDAFWVPGEYERYLFARDIVSMRRKILVERKRRSVVTSLSNPEISDLHNLPSENSIPISPTTPTSPSGNKRFMDNYSYHTRRSASISTISSVCSATSSAMQVESDESIYNAIFTYAIYYSHMTFEELNSILHDCDPTTGVPFSPDYVIKDALWQQIDLRNKIENATETDVTLGISSSEILTSSTGVHFEIPSDDTTHIGEALTGLEDMIGGGTKAMKDGEDPSSPCSNNSSASSLMNVSPLNKSPTSSPSDERFASSTRQSMLMKNGDKSFSRYADKRKTVRTWFKIFCPSRGPSHVLTQFQSSPDNFALMQNDYLLDVRDYDTSASAISNSSSSTLKFSVVMGHV
ncbi:17508_t:CDS:2 [Racocetra fulgida]|uniref:17508_t:CDS:1 n=1 Tax=Racocetra fulgida TaxID=60492 RepID=A0A9N8WJD6_9GLOM|nr:17508_t:CDS:2 [Racocetra fulgida]